MSLKNYMLSLKRFFFPLKPEEICSICSSCERFNKKFVDSWIRGNKIFSTIKNRNNFQIFRLSLLRQIFPIPFRDMLDMKL